jgi:putative ABC transport system substrate-binding protein
LVTRREILTIAAAQAIAAPLALAQQAKRVWRLGFLIPSLPFKPNEPNVYGTAFVQEMQTQGFAYQTDYTVDIRSAEGQFARLPELAGELAKTVDVLVPISTASARAAHQATRTLPIVFVGVHDPVEIGLAESLARPGTNCTGVATFYGDLIPKQMELLKTIAPQLSHIGILTDEDFEKFPALVARMRNAAASLSTQVQFFSGSSEQQINRAFVAIARERNGAVLVVSDPYLLAQRQLIAQLAAKQRLPSIFGNRENVTAGGLMCYGESATEAFVMTAKYIARILNGTKPGELPIEQPTTIQFVINRGTARVLGISIPQDLLVRADELIDTPPSLDQP